MTNHRETFSKPDFICAAPPRTGTTWLHTALQAHPAAWVPPVKEINVLASGEGERIPNYSLRQLAFSQHGHYRYMRTLPHRALLKPFAGRMSFADARWMLRYVFRFQQRNEPFRFYSSLFSHTKNLIAGDISSTNYYLSEAKIEKLASFFPSTKIIIFVRNPIERDWSALLLLLVKQRKTDFDQVSQNELETYADTLYNKMWKPYDKCISIWNKYFSKVFIGQFDHLKQDSSSYYREICSFIGIEPVQIDSVNKKIHPNKRIKIPEYLAERLRQQYQDEIYRLADLGYCPDPQTWLDYGRQ